MLGSLFYPRVCPMCECYVGEKTAPGRLCDRCMHELPRTEQAELRQNETEMSLAGKKTKDIVAAMKCMHIRLRQTTAISCIMTRASFRMKTLTALKNLLQTAKKQANILLLKLTPVLGT